MALNITIQKHEIIKAVEVPADVATDLKDTCETLAELPANQVAVQEFDGDDAAKQARAFISQVKYWAHVNGAVFTRKGNAPEGNVTERPGIVTFRLVPRAAEEPEVPASE